MRKRESRQVTARLAVVGLLTVVVLCAGLVGCGGTLARTEAESNPVPAWQTVNNEVNQGHYQQAIADAQNALAGHPMPADQVGLWYSMAMAYSRMGNVEQTQAALNRVLQFPETYNNWRSAAMVTLGYLEMDTDWTATTRYFRQAHRLDPTMIDPVHGLAADHLMHGRYAQARHYADWVIAYGNDTSCCDAVASDRNTLISLAYEIKAFAELGLGQRDDALNLLSQHAGWLDQTLAYYALGDAQRLDAARREGYLGVTLQDLTITTFAHKGDKQGKTESVVQVGSVAPGSPAAASLKAGDLILSINGESGLTAARVQEIMKQSPPGTVLNLVVRRRQPPAAAGAVPQSVDLTIPVRTGDVTQSSYIRADNWRIAAYMKKREALRQAAEAEQRGDLDGALAQYVNYIRAVDGALDDVEMVRHAIEETRRVNPPPAIPEETHRHAVRAQVMLKDLGPNDDFGPAENEFRQALRVAPWWADAWFNLALAQDTAGQPQDAIASLKNFLYAAPNDPSASQVQDKIYALQVESEDQRSDRWSGNWFAESGQTGQQSWTAKYGSAVVGSSIQIRVKHGKLTATLLKPAEKLAAGCGTLVGGSLGGLFLTGTVQGQTFSGTATAFTKQSGYDAECSGETRRTGELSSDGRYLKISHTDHVVYAVPVGTPVDNSEAVTFDLTFIRLPD